MIKLIALLVLVNNCVVYGQRGSFMGIAKEPLCVKVNEYVIIDKVMLDWLNW